MSTILQTNPAHPASFAPVRSAIVHLCWKELKQVIPAHLAIVCVAFVVVFAIQMFSSEVFVFNVLAESPILLWNTINILSAVVCAAIFYGMDRENGSWAWQSSLPVSWQLSAVSRLLTAGSLFLAIAIGGWVFIRIVMFETPDQYHFGTSILLGGIFWVQTYCVFAIVLMMVGDILWGLILAAGLVVAIQTLLPLPTKDTSVDLLAITSTGSELVLWRVGILVSLQVFLLVLVLVAHAWRWNHGCYSNVADGMRQRFRWWVLLPTLSISAGDFANSKSQPGQYRSLFWLSLRQYFLIRLAIVVGALVCLVTTLIDPDFLRYRGGEVAGFFTASIVLLGISVFAGDQAKKRHLAIANRGVSPETFWFIRILAPLLVAILLGAVIYGPKLDHVKLDPAITGFGVLLFFAAQFAGLCFRSVVMAIIVTMVAGWCFGVAIFLGYWSMPIQIRLDPSTPVWMSGLATGGLVIASLWCCRRWFVLDNPRLVQAYIWIASTYLVLGFVFGAGEKYTSIPNVAWTGGTIQSVSASISRLTHSPPPAGNRTSVNIREIVFPRISSDTTELIDRHLSTITRKQWEALPSRFTVAMQYSVRSEMIPLSNDELELAANGVRQYLESLSKYVEDTGGRIPVQEIFDHRLDVQLQSAVTFCLDQKLWPESTSLLAEMGRIRSNQILKAALGARVGWWLVGNGQPVGILGPEQVSGLGGPEVVRELLKPIFFSADEALVFVTDMMAPLRFGMIESPEFISSLDGEKLGPYLGYRTSNTGSGWLVRHLEAKIAAAQLELHLTAMRRIQQQSNINRANLAFSGKVNENLMQSLVLDWYQYPFTDNSVLPSSLCSFATTLAANWEIQISPMLDQMEKDQENQDQK